MNGISFIILLHLILFVKFNGTNAKNTLLIFADDAGLELGCLGHPVIKTPNIDKLGTKSTIFTNAFTSVSSCSPSRSAILTGLPIHQNGMNGLHHDVHHFNSYNDVQSLPQMLNKANLLTGIIGKKHVGPSDVYNFNVEHTEENHSILQVGRNITHIKLLVRKFLQRAKDLKQNFFLYVAFHDPHRCGHTHPEFGDFCEKFGNGNFGMGVIPDWNPLYYKPEDVMVPYFVQDTPAAREDIANQYTTISRLDQGVGVLIEELESWNLINDTMIIFSSDNGIPFPSGRTNFYDPGVHQPLMISVPKDHYDSKNYVGQRVETTLVSLLDILPTILDWHQVELPNYFILKKNVSYTGTSLLQLPNDPNRLVFGSHNFHEITMSYPMRYVRSRRYKLIHNLEFGSTFPIDQDFYLSSTFQDLLQRTYLNQSLHWYKKNLSNYYRRPEFELYDLKVDPEEMYNVASKPLYQEVFNELRSALHEWQKVTFDPWLCAPHAVFEDKGHYKDQPRCLPLLNFDEL